MHEDDFKPPLPRRQRCQHRLSPFQMLHELLL
jgi:hypothetical protein